MHPTETWLHECHQASQAISSWQGCFIWTFPLGIISDTDFRINGAAQFIVCYQGTCIMHRPATFFVVYLSSSQSTLSHLSFILLGMLCIAPIKQDSCQMRLTLPSPYRVDFISGTHHLNRHHLWFRLVTSIMTTISQLAVVETLSVLGLTPHLTLLKIRMELPIHD